MTAGFNAVIGAMLAKSTARLAVVDDGISTVVEVGLGTEADPSVVALHALILFLGGMQMVTVLEAALTG